jgi:hypothetical protein
MRVGTGNIFKANATQKMNIGHTTQPAYPVIPENCAKFAMARTKTLCLKQREISGILRSSATTQWMQVKP